jgi:hypothetical protein
MSVHMTKFGITVHAMGKLLLSEMSIFPILIPRQGLCVAQNMLIASY